MAGRIVLGLDVGTYSIKAAELQIGFQGLEFVRFEEGRMPSEAPREERIASVQRFLEEKELSTESVLCALPADRVTQRHLRFPFTAPRKIAEAIPFEIEEDLPFPLADTIWTQTIALGGVERTGVLVVLSPQTEVTSYLSELQEMGCEPRILEMGGAVLANLLSFLGLSERSHLVLNVGHSRTDLCLVVRGSPILLRSIPIAGRHLTEALAKDLNLGLDAAETYKHETGIFESGSTQLISPSAAQLLERLATETLRSVQSLVGDPLDELAPTEILLVGGSSRMPELAAYFAEHCGLPCSTLAVPASCPGGALLADAGAAPFAEAAALALRHSRKHRTTRFDFRQGSLSYVPDLSGLSAQLRVAVILFLSALLLWPLSLWAGLRAQTAHARALHAQLEGICTQTFPAADCATDPYRAIESEVRTTRRLAEHLGVTGNGLSSLEIMREISERIPPGLDISLRELKIERRSLLARGRSKDLASVDQMREALSQFEGFKDVRLTDVQNNPRGRGKSFSLTIRFAEGQ